MPKLLRVRDPEHPSAYYYPVCQRCGKPKGKSKSKLCISCAHYKPKKGLIHFECPHCKQPLSRDELILTLYWAGVGSDTLGKAFGLTKQRILQIIRAEKKSP